MNRAATASPLRDYLEFYKRQTSPGYAVLVTGAWGAGKTYQVKKIIEEEERWYVSLFGKESAEEIHAAVLAEANPKWAALAQHGDRAADVAKESGFFPSWAQPLLASASTVANAVLRKSLKPDRCLVFDDLERSNIHLKDLLGVINLYVEHYGFRVVVIAHDGEAAKELREVKEKLFGQVICVAAEVEDAVEAFIARLRTESGREFVRTHIQELLSVFRASGQQSLRLLKHLIEDCERLAGALDPKYRTNTSALVQLLRLFAALNIEIRAGNIEGPDLRKRQEAIITGHFKKGADAPVPSLFVANARYPMTELGDQIVHDDLLHAMLIEGRYDSAEIGSSLAMSPLFAEPRSVPAWRSIYHFDSLSDSVVEEAFARMQEEFEGRKIENLGELLHVFSLRLMMVREGIMSSEVDAEVAAAKTYIDDLAKAGRLAPRSLNYSPFPEFDTGHDQYGFWDNDTAEFQEIKEYLHDARGRVLAERLPAMAQKLLGTMLTDPDKVFSLLGQSSDAAKNYAYVPILSEIKPDDLIDAVLNLDPGTWRQFGYALIDRYRGFVLRKQLKAEAAWLKELDARLASRASELPGFAGLRLRRLHSLIFSDMSSALSETDG